MIRLTKIWRNPVKTSKAWLKCTVFDTGYIWAEPFETSRFVWETQQNPLKAALTHDQTDET